ncbi:MAG: hypothetical protein HDR28_03250 [Lachnospiraceae bacterium]|nr:hypothetical protein [Lachnospiraceae bacterium]
MKQYLSYVREDKEFEEYKQLFDEAETTGVTIICSLTCNVACSLPIELTVYTNDKEENVRYKIEIYGETGKSITDYYLCENFIYVNQEREYYSSQILMKNYDDILYRRTSDWIITEDKVYILQDNGKMKEDAEYSFFPIEEVND